MISSGCTNYIIITFPFGLQIVIYIVNEFFKCSQWWLVSYCRLVSNLWSWTSKWRVVVNYLTKYLFQLFAIPSSPDNWIYCKTIGILTDYVCVKQAWNVSIRGISCLNNWSWWASSFEVPFNSSILPSPCHLKESRLIYQWNILIFTLTEHVV